MIWRIGTVVVLLCAMLGWASAEDGALETPPMVEVPQLETMQLAEVVRVVDGDTVLLAIQGQEVSFELLGANAPEYIERDPTPRKHAREAWFALHVLLEGESVYIHQDPAYRKTAAGRMTGFLFRAPDLLFVNQEIIRQGYAKHTPARSAMFREALAWWHQRAMDAEKGIWSDDPVVLVEPTQPEPTTPSPKIEPGPVKEPPATTPTPQQVGGDSQDYFVYLTKSGSKYHTKECRYYSSSSRRVKVTDARKLHGACKVCKPDERDG